MSDDALDVKPVAWRALRPIGRGGPRAWTAWMLMPELNHFNNEGNIVDGPAPEWKVEYAYGADLLTQLLAEREAAAKELKARDDKIRWLIEELFNVSEAK